VKKQRDNDQSLPLGWTKTYAKTEDAKLTLSRAYVEHVLVTPPGLSSLDERIAHAGKAHEELRREHYLNLYITTLAPLAAIVEEIIQANPDADPRYLMRLLDEMAFDKLSLTAEKQTLILEALSHAEEIAFEYIAVLKEKAFADQWIQDLIKEWREEARWGKTEHIRKIAYAKLNRIVTALTQRWVRGRPRVEEEKKRQTRQQATSRSKALSRWVKKFEEDKAESGDAEGACKRTLIAFDKSTRIKDPHQKSLILQKLAPKLRALVAQERQ
jgi:hypothetical protein